MEDIKKKIENIKKKIKKEIIMKEKIEIEVEQAKKKMRQATNAMNNLLNELKIERIDYEDAYLKEPERVTSLLKYLFDIWEEWQQGDDDWEYRSDNSITNDDYSYHYHSKYITNNEVMQSIENAFEKEEKQCIEYDDLYYEYLIQLRFVYKLKDEQKDLENKQEKMRKKHNLQEQIIKTVKKLNDLYSQRENIQSQEYENSYINEKEKNEKLLKSFLNKKNTFD